MLVDQSSTDRVSIGLYRSAHSTWSPSVYTATLATTVERLPQPRSSCGTTCRLELRGDLFAIEALVDDRPIERWPRTTFRITAPHVQLNAEVDHVGDSIASRFSSRPPLGDKSLPSPTYDARRPGTHDGRRCPGVRRDISP